MAQRWFVSRAEHIYGPWSTEDVRAHQKGGNVTKADVIWGIGESTWVRLGDWDPSVPVRAAIQVEVDLVATVNPKPTLVAVESSGSSIDTEVTQLTATRSVMTDAWHFAFEGKSMGPFDRATLIIELRRLPSLDQVSLWTKGMRQWAPVVEFLDILNELGANQRQHARADIVGQVTLKFEGLTQVAPLTSISEGGFGLKLNSELVSGQMVSVEVQSPALGGPIKATAEIRYCAQGVVGLRFESIEGAARATIARFVRQQSTREAKAA